MTLRVPKVKTAILISQIAIEPARLGCPFPAPALRSWGEGRGGFHNAGRSRNSSRYQRQRPFSVRREAARFPPCKVHLSPAGGVPLQVLVRQHGGGDCRVRGSTPSSLRPETPLRIDRVRTSPRPSGNVRAAIIADTENAYRTDRLIFWRSNERAPAAGGIQEEN